MGSQNQFSSSNTSHFDEGDEERDRVRAGQVREQKEIQLLEARIREAASKAMVGGKGSISNSNNSNSNNSSNGSNNGSSSSGNDKNDGSSGLSERQQELERERRIEYSALAARYNESDTKDTVNDAERNRGATTTVSVFIALSPSFFCSYQSYLSFFFISNNETII